MKLKTLLPTAAVFFLTFAVFAADMKILVEVRAPKTVEFSHATVEFVGEHTAQSSPFVQIKRTEEGTTNVFHESFVIYTSLYKERRFAVIIHLDASPKSMAQVFPLPTGKPKATIEWSKWQKPSYIENSKDASSNVMDDVKSPDRSTNIPPDCFEVRYKIEDSK